MELELLIRLNQFIADRVTVILATELDSGKKRLIAQNDFNTDLLKDHLNYCAESRRSTIIKTENQSIFLCLYEPKLKLVIVGAGRIAQALINFANQSGYKTLIVDPRSAFATTERFPDIEIFTEWPDLAFKKIKLDKKTAVICLSHDPKIDDVALSQALNSDCFYIGALGSRKSQEARKLRLNRLGFSSSQLSRIHGPIGLNIGASDPIEIAISIIAELVLLNRKKDLR